MIIDGTVYVNEGNDEVYSPNNIPVVYYQINSGSGNTTIELPSIDIGRTALVSVDSFNSVGVSKNVKIGGSGSYKYFRHNFHDASTDKSGSVGVTAAGNIFLAFNNPNRYNNYVMIIYTRIS